MQFILSCRCSLFFKLSLHIPSVCGLLVPTAQYSEFRHCHCLKDIFSIDIYNSYLMQISLTDHLTFTWKGLYFTIEFETFSLKTKIRLFSDIKCFFHQHFLLQNTYFDIFHVIFSPVKFGIENIFKDRKKT